MSVPVLAAAEPATRAAEPVIRIRELAFRWSPGAQVVLALDALDVGAGERVFIDGPSGSGKPRIRLEEPAQPAPHRRPNPCSGRPH